MPYKFPCTVDAVKAILSTLTDDEAKAAAVHIDSSWNDSPLVNLVSNSPEVGMPMRRLRSRNIKHTTNISFSIDNYWYNKLWLAFIRALHGGVDHMMFPELTYNRAVDSGAEDIRWRPAVFSMENGTAYSIKRQDNYTYTISATVIWIEEDAIDAYQS